MNLLTKTNEYYSKWLGEDDIINSDFTGVKFIYSSERNTTQYGYAQKFDLYVFYQSDKIIFSYGDELIEKIYDVKN